GTVGCDRFEGAVVSCGDDGIMDGRVKAPGRLVARGECQLCQTQEVGASVESTRTIQARELGVRTEARQNRLEPVEFSFCGREGIGCILRIHEELDLRAHGMERAALHHDVLVMVSGGSDTTRTDGAAAAASWACWVAEIFACR